MWTSGKPGRTGWAEKRKGGHRGHKEKLSAYYFGIVKAGK